LCLPGKAYVKFAKLCNFLDYSRIGEFALSIPALPADLG
jgi:hypothetical protein